MDDAIDERGGAGGVGEDGRPFAEGKIRGEHDAPLFVAARDDLEEQVGISIVEGEVSNLVDHEEALLGIMAQLSIERARRLLRAELEEKLRGRDDEDGVPGEDRLVGDVLDRRQLLLPVNDNYSCRSEPS